MTEPIPRVVLVTGASGGLGRAIGERFAREGDVTYLGYRKEAGKAQELADDLRGEGLDARPIGLDLSAPESVAAAFAEIEAQAGTVDVVVNNAAYRPIGPFLEIDEAEWEAVLSVNLMGAVRCAKLALPGMLERGRGWIVNISGIDAIWGWGNRAHVTVSKAGLSGLTRALAVEFSGRGIRANTLVLGTFRVPRDPEIYPEWETMRSYLVERIPVGRQGEAEEVAEWCWLLTTSAAGYMSGQDIHLNGGVFPLLRNPLLDADAAGR
jgi:3-oxoacyl-[acyl-carrier protein] reductase